MAGGGRQAVRCNHSRPPLFLDLDSIENGSEVSTFDWCGGRCIATADHGRLVPSVTCLFAGAGLPRFLGRGEATGLIFVNPCRFHPPRDRAPVPWARRRRRRESSNQHKHSGVVFRHTSRGLEGGGVGVGVGGAGAEWGVGGAGEGTRRGCSGRSGRSWRRLST